MVVEWWLNGVWHRNSNDGPAILYPDGTKKYFVNGLLHRIGSPAVEYPNGTKLWYVNGVLQ